jgi:hypothetical protein
MFRNLNLFWIALTCLMGCSNGQESAPVISGGERVLQIAILSDSANPITKYFGFPEKPILESFWKSRVIWEIPSDKDISDRISYWTSRDLDFLVLGPGKPVEIWKNSKFARAITVKKIFLVGSSQNVRDGIGIAVDPSTVREIQKKLGTKEYELELNWESLFRESIQGLKSAESLNWGHLDAFSGLLKIQTTNGVLKEKARLLMLDLLVRDQRTGK